MGESRRQTLPRAATAGAALVPIPWSSAGFTLPPGDFVSSHPPAEAATPIPLEAPVTVVVVVSVCAKTNGGPFPIPGGLVCSTQAPTVTSLPNGVIALATPQYQFDATLASTAESRWSVELVNPTLVIPNAAVVGDTFAVPKVTGVRIFIDAFPSATFTVPDVTAAPTEAIAFRRLPSNLASSVGLPIVEARSGALETSARPFSPGLLESFLDGDEITLVGRVSFGASFLATEPRGQIAFVAFERVDPCGSSTSAESLPQRSCQVGLELLSANASTPTASLACRADFDSNGVVNFADLARFRSVFLQSCVP